MTALTPEATTRDDEGAPSGALGTTESERVASSIVSEPVRSPAATKAIKKLAKQFAYLDALRKSGVTNMFGASPHLEDAFRLKRGTGTPILRDWMRSFCDKPADERAAEVYDAEQTKAGA